MDTVTCAIVLVGMCLGAAGGWLVARSLNARLLAEIAGVNARLEERSKQVSQLEQESVVRKQELGQALGHVSKLQQDNALLVADAENQRRSATEKIELIEHA